MGALNPFAKPKVPAIQAPPPPPVIDNTAAEREKAERDALMRLKRQRGRAATIIAQGDDSSGIATKQLLGI